MCPVSFSIEEQRLLILITLGVYRIHNFNVPVSMCIFGMKRKNLATPTSLITEILPFILAHSRQCQAIRDVGRIVLPTSFSSQVRGFIGNYQAGAVQTGNCCLELGRNKVVWVVITAKLSGYPELKSITMLFRLSTSWAYAGKRGPADMFMNHVKKKPYQGMSETL